jgi:hypothetical protein
MWEKTIKELLKNTPLALVVIGVFLVVLGATGGFEKLGIKVGDAPWRIALAAMGVVVAGFGTLVLLRGQVDGEISALAKECGLKITSPKSNSEVEERVTLEGSYKKKPPNKTLAVLERSPSSGRFWFKKQPPVYDEKEKQWSFTDVYVGTDQGGARILYVAVLGESGKALQDFYLAVREEFGKPAGVESLTPDIVLCDYIKVRRKSKATAPKTEPATK